MQFMPVCEKSVSDKLRLLLDCILPAEGVFGEDCMYGTRTKEI